MEIVCQASTTTHHVFITSSFPPIPRKTEKETPRGKVRILLGTERVRNFNGDAVAVRCCDPRSTPPGKEGTCTSHCRWLCSQSHSAPNCHSRVHALSFLYYSVHTVFTVQVGGEFGGGDRGKCLFEPIAKCMASPVST